MTRYLIGVLALVVAFQFAYLSTLKSQREHLKDTVEQRDEKIAKLESDSISLQKALTERDLIDKKYTEELTNAQVEIDKLRDDLRAGTKRVFVNAVCPAPVQHTTGTPSVADATRIELDSNAREDYLHLRRELEADRVKIEGLQEYITGICLRSSDET